MVTYQNLAWDRKTFEMLWCLGMTDVLAVYIVALRLDESTYRSCHSHPLYILRYIYTVRSGSRRCFPDTCPDHHRHCKDRPTVYQLHDRKKETIIVRSYNHSDLDRHYTIEKRKPL